MGKTDKNMTQAVAEAAQKASENTLPAPRRATVASPVGLNLRRGPGLEVLRILPDGTELALVDVPAEAAIDGWCPVITDNGERGWVMEQYLQSLEG